MYIYDFKFPDLSTEHRADEIEKPGDVVHGEQNGSHNTHNSNSDGRLFPVQPAGQGLGRDTGGPGIQECSSDGGKDQDDQGGHAQARLYHDNGDVILPGEHGGPHADDIHPAGHQAIDDDADPGGPGGLLGLAGVVADEGQPAQGHGHRQLHRCAEGHGLPGGGDGTAGEEDDLAQHQGEQEQGRHGQLVDPAQVGDAHGDPQDDEGPDDQTPHPAARIEDAADGQGPVIDHDGRPAHQLQHIQQGEQQPAPLAEAHFHRLHGGAAGAPADQARQQHHGAADDVAQENGRQPPSEPKGCEGGPRQDLGQGDARAEPDQAVLQGRGLFHRTNSPRRSNMWSMGPEPCPRSSMAARAPEIYALARRTDWSRS